MQINWGTKIAILYGGFVCLILFMVFKASSLDFSLVSEDYYQQEIQYQGRIQQKANSQKLATPLAIDYQPEAGMIQIHYPLAVTEGTIKLYRPSDAKLDREYPVQVETGNIQSLSTSQLLAGMWKVQVQWQAAGEHFFDEKSIVLY